MKLIHRDLHIGNIHYFSHCASITDIGLCKPVDYNASEDTKNSGYGVLPYVDPEILRGQKLLPPYHDVSHD
jgi:serine/threonine protein kinase